MQGLAVYGESEDREILVKEGFRTGAKKDSFVLFLNFMSYEKNCYYGVKRCHLSSENPAIIIFTRKSLLHF